MRHEERGVRQPLSHTGKSFAAAAEGRAGGAAPGGRRLRLLPAAPGRALSNARLTGARAVCSCNDFTGQQGCAETPCRKPRSGRQKPAVRKHFRSRAFHVLKALKREAAAGGNRRPREGGCSDG